MATRYVKIPAHAKPAETITALTADGKHVEVTRYLPHTSSVTHSDGVQWVGWRLGGQHALGERFSGRRVTQLTGLVDEVTTVLREEGCTDIAHVVYVEDGTVRARKAAAA